MDGLENFNRNWAGYQNGFGDRHGEFWAGKSIFQLRYWTIISDNDIITLDRKQPSESLW